MRLVMTVAVAALFLSAAMLQATSEESLNSGYQKALADHFNVPTETVARLAESVAHSDEVPVVLYLANCAGVSTDEIIIARQLRTSWQRISALYGLTAESFYVIAVGQIKSKTFTPIFEKFRTTPKHKWAHMQLTDQEIISLVNLKFLYSYYDYSVYEIMAMRDYSNNFLKVNEKAACAKAELIKRELASQQ